MSRSLQFPRRFSFQAIAAFLLLGLSFSFLAAAQDSQDAPKRGRKYKAPPPTAHFEVTVTRATNGKPVENASVVFHPLINGKDSGNMELKTNDEGKAVLDLLEIGTSVRVQVLAPGFQTYGEDYKVDKDTIAVGVQLKRPQGQYSIYKKSEGKPDGTEPQKDAPANPPADSSKQPPAAQPKL